MVSVQRFFQRVDDQLITLFGLHLPGGPDSAGHYFVASAGGVDADGWAFRVSNVANPRLKGSIDYSITRTRWQGRGDFTRGQRSARPIAWRPESEDLHDITTSLETDIPETATRVVVVYKVNTGYARVDQTQPGPGLDGRFNVQLNQALPFDFAGTRWEILVGRPKPVPRSHRSGFGLRRAARRPAAEAGRRRLPRSLLSSATSGGGSVFLDPDSSSLEAAGQYRPKTPCLSIF